MIATFSTASYGLRHFGDKKIPKNKKVIKKKEKRPLSGTNCGRSRTVSRTVVARVYNPACLVLSFVREECVAPFQWHQERKKKTIENDNKEEKVL